MDVAKKVKRFYNAPMQIFSAENQSSIEKAARILIEGGIGAFPTETVYGLGADATNIHAVARVFEAKARPVFDPLIVHVAAPKDVDEICLKVPDEVRKLMKRFWPGPLTFVLPKKDVIPALVTAGLDTVAVRMPDHPAARRLLKAAGRPLAAPSANLFGSTSPTNAEDVIKGLGERIDFVLDGGICRVGIESTILKVEKGRIELMRPGGISVEEIQKVFPRKKILRLKHRVYEAPGQMDRHYATETPLIFSHDSPEKLRPKLKVIREDCGKNKSSFPRIGALTFKPIENDIYAKVFYLSKKADLREAATNLFYGMRKLDARGLDLIVAERMREEGLGTAINDRLKRASCGADIIGLLKSKLGINKSMSRPAARSRARRTKSKGERS